MVPRFVLYCLRFLREYSYARHVPRSIVCSNLCMRYSENSKNWYYIKRDISGMLGNSSWKACIVTQIVWSKDCTYYYCWKYALLKNRQLGCETRAGKTDKNRLKYEKKSKQQLFLIKMNFAEQSSAVSSKLILRIHFSIIDFRYLSLIPVSGVTDLYNISALLVPQLTNEASWIELGPLAS